MSDKEIINLLLERAQKCYPVALAVHPVFERELCVKDPYKYREIIDKMVEQELVKNTFGDFIRILPRGEAIVGSGGHMKYTMLQPVKHPKKEQIKKIRHSNRKASADHYFTRVKMWPLLRSLVAVSVSFFTLHK